ncbi:hypothetical protein EIP86_007902 [Pleurotus ostreatoroseus]|nr:hypothetical protein EIP86_007902 [Pleurotus ostreatoroseus]
MENTPSATDNNNTARSQVVLPKQAARPHRAPQKKHSARHRQHDGQAPKHDVQPRARTRDASPPAVDHPSRISNVREQPQAAPSPTFTAHLQPYPGPPDPYAMHPNYQMNGHPYQSSPSPFHQPAASASAHNGHSPHVGPGIPAQYAYPVHHPSYPAHAYPAYPQYPAAQSMMMYGAPGPSHVDQQQQQPQQPEASPPPAPASATGKRKRKYPYPPPATPPAMLTQFCADSTGDAGRTPTTPSAAPGQSETKKRTKTQRACDSCRSRKIRCDVLADSDPPICQHCKQYGFDCTFFLPITETRFKKKRLEEEAERERERDKERSTSSPNTDGARGSDVRVFGPTSPAYLLHSQAMITSRMYENYDMRYHHSWDVSTDGNGVIQVHEPKKGEYQTTHPKPADLHIERDVVEKLVNAYFQDVAPLLPVITREEFLANSPPPPILLYAMCLVAAARREVPQAVFESIRYAVNSLIKAEDVLSTATIVNLQSLLILCMVGDCHSQHVPNALSALWVRLGCAIRMAQDLGLHRAETVKQNIELRRRLWSLCVISDRCESRISITYGHPYMIEVQDCDARLPSSGDATDLYLDQLVRLSVIVGRVQKNIYTPAGLAVTSDEALSRILLDLDGWRTNLPEELQFRGPESGRHADTLTDARALGLLFLFYCCVNMLFWRVFMRISYSCPEHLKFALTVEKWTQLVQLSSDAIDWLDAHERMYDVWLLVAYCATSCALIQYHTYARRQDQDAMNKLKKLRDCVRKWEASISQEHMSARRKTAEIISLLYEATQGPQQPLEAPALNPTGGVKAKQPLGGLQFKKDPTRPGGGVFIAHGSIPESLDKNLPAGTIINEEAERAKQARQGQPMVNYTPLTGSHPNMNPALNEAGALPPGHIQVMNVLDVPANNANALEQMAMADSGYLQGIPNTIFDWGECFIDASGAVAREKRKLTRGADRAMGHVLLALQQRPSSAGLWAASAVPVRRLGPPAEHVMNLYGKSGQSTWSFASRN